MSRAPRAGVVIVVQNLPVPQDRRVWLEATSLAEAGHETSVIAIRGRGQRWAERRDGVNVYRYPPPPEAGGVMGYALEFSYCWVMTAVLSVLVLVRHGFGALHACNPPDTYFLLGRIYQLFGKKFVYDQHDICPEMYQARFARPTEDFLYRTLRRLERATYRAADVVISPNESYRRIAIARGGRTVDDTTVVRSGPSMKAFGPVDPVAELRRGAAHLIAYVGVIGPQDGVGNAIHALDHLVRGSGRRDVRLAILGTGDDLPNVRELTNRLGLAEVVDFVGWSDTPTMLAYLSTASVCIVPDPKDPYSDQSTHNKVIEYMAVGKPMVAFDLTEVRRSAADAALYATPNDTADLARRVAVLLDDPEQRAAMGQFARERFEQVLAWEHSKESLLAMYDQLLRPPGNVTSEARRVSTSTKTTPA